MEYTTEYWNKWDIQSKKDIEDMKRGCPPRLVHWPVEMLTIEEIIEKYSIDQKTVDNLRKATE